MNITDKIIAHEQGELDEAGILQLFAELIKSKMAWSLQGHYGRTAKALIDAEYISEDGKHIFYQDIVQ
tara:strand:+ start:718 stop:921 length:204 start_codon:yes stop_codon:yes gene_type:complete